MKNNTILLLAFLLVGMTAQGQSTFTEVYNIFQGNCATYCHGGSNPSGQLNLTGTEGEVYDAIVNVNPVNPAALAKLDKIVKPGHPSRSFLLRKCNGDIEVSEGNTMPTGQSLEDAEIALIENWILFGAPQTGEIVDYQVIQDYYNGEGLSNVVEPMEKPDPEDGFQIHLGSIYLPPSTEVEYFLKQDIANPLDMEVIGLDNDMNESSHHFLMYKFNEGTASGFSDGLRLLGVEESDDVTSLVVAWQFDNEINLPAGTAYSWEANTSLDLNYHVVNYSTDSILKAELYCNVYTQPAGTAENEMYSDLILYDPMQFYLPADGQNHVFSAPVYNESSNLQLNVWMLSSHTHKYGVDYDIYKRNADGSQGEQLYEGFYNTDYTFNQGYYDWEHPAIRYFEPFESINYSEGFIHTATFNNYGDDPVFFNVTTDDEMMLFFIQYTASLIGGVEEEDKEELILYPNPLTFGDDLFVDYNKTEEVHIQIYDITGQLLYLGNDQFTQGVNRLSADLFQGLSNGVYQVTILGSDQQLSSRVVLNK